jgi:hypothetical protein
VRYGRTVHSDLLTHRQFSRNGKSSRAKPIKAYIREVLDDPAKPVYWGAARKGMQSSADQIKYPFLANLAYHIGRYTSIGIAWSMDKLGVHKQMANRYLEPYIHIDVLITSTESGFANFFALRTGQIDGAADPNLQKISRMMARALRESTPKVLGPREWHLPFINSEDLSNISLYVGPKSDMTPFTTPCKVSAARCARLSYYEYGSDKRSSIDADLKLFDKLMNEGIPHASPTEHQATPAVSDLGVSLGGNFGPDWVQFRKTIPNECQSSFDLESITDEEFIIK